MKTLPITKQTKAYNAGQEEGVRSFIKLLVKELTLMEKKSDGILLNKGQVDFLKTFLTSEKNIKSFLKDL